MGWKTVSKSALLAVGITIVTTGASVVKDQLEAGIIIIALGLGCVITYAYLLEKQAVEKALERLKKGE